MLFLFQDRCQSYRQPASTSPCLSHTNSLRSGTHGGCYKYCKYCMEEATNIANTTGRMLQILQILRNWQFCKYLSLPNLISEWCTQLCDKQKSLRKLWPNCFGQVSFKSCPSVPKIFQSLQLLSCCPF